MENLRFADNHIRGEQSGYLREEHRAEIARYFANASLLTIPDAGHWATQPERFITALLGTLAN